MNKPIVNLLLLILSILLSYTAVEIVYSYLYINHYIGKYTLWFHEASNPGNNIVFNPDIGYKISKTPSRFGAITSDGQLESIGIMQGNNFGFPDERNFVVEPKDTNIKRIAILGDSFTASQFTEKSWVEIIEDNLNRELNDSIMFMNFSLDGGGLGNWSSIVKNVILKNNFQLDGIVFAILGDDLDRQFMWKNDYIISENKYALAAGKNDTWNPSLNPGYEDTLNPFFLENYLVLSSEECNKIEEGNWKYNREIKPYLFEKFKEISRGIIFRIKYPELFQTAKASNIDFFSMQQKVLIQSLNEDCKRLNIPILSFSFLADHNKSKAFANILDSHFLNDDAFQTTFQDSNKSLNIEGDGHWNNYGTQLFAKSMYTDFKNALKEADIIN